MAAAAPEDPVAKAIASLRSLKAAEEAAGATIARPRDCDAVIASVKDILRELAAARESWWKPEYLEANPAVGFTTRYLNHEADSTLALQLVTWLPGRHVPPHNHGSWTVATCLMGREKNIVYEREDPSVNDSPLKATRVEEFGPGDAVSFHPDTIHSVENVAAGEDARSVSLHVYGWHSAGETEFWVYPGGEPGGLDAYQPQKRLQHNVYSPPVAAADAAAADAAAAPATA